MKKWISGQHLIQLFENWVPKSLAFENDRIGLLIGTLDKEIKKVMVTLDVLENVADEAAEKGVDLIIAHHPVIFHPLKKVLSDEGQGKIVAKCIRHDIAVYAAHTNLDIADGGVNDMLSERLGLQNTSILKQTYQEPLFKIAVFVPDSHIEKVRSALGEAGAGAIGRYSHCTFTAAGSGTFLPEEGTNPYIGQKGVLEKVSEGKVETIVPEHLLNKAINAMLKVHPYEEVAYDVYPLQNEGKAYGLGRIGRLPEAVTFEALCQDVKQRLGLDGLRVVGDLTGKVRTVAVSGGDGNSLIPYAKYRGADVLITGDIYYHTAHDAILHGLKVIDAGHHIEKIMKSGVKEYLEKSLKKAGYQTEVVLSEANTNPFQFI